MVRTDDFRPIYDALASQKRQIPTRILRFLREQVYELVNVNEPQGRVYVQDIDAATDPSDVDVVLGVGIKSKLDSSELGSRGYRLITRNELLQDILAETSKYDPAKIVAERLPELVRGGTLTPCFRYLASIGFKISCGIWTPDPGVGLTAWLETVATRLQPDSPGYVSYKRMAREHASAGRTLSSIPAENELRQLTVARFMPLGSINPVDLREFLLDKASRMLSASAPSGCLTQYAALVCVYDLLMYSPSCGVVLEQNSTPTDGA